MNNRSALLEIYDLTTLPSLLVQCQQHSTVSNHLPHQETKQCAHTSRTSNSKIAFSKGKEAEIVFIHETHSKTPPQLNCLLVYIQYHLLKNNKCRGGFRGSKGPRPSILLKKMFNRKCKNVQNSYKIASNSLKMLEIVFRTIQNSTFSGGAFHGPPPPTYWTPYFTAPPFEYSWTRP